jgi:hypothetical protein
MSKCPYCGSQIEGRMAMPRLSARQVRIYDAVAAAGPDGISAESLLKKMYNGEKQTAGSNVVMRVTIHYMNARLTEIGQRVQGGIGGRYRLTSLKG